MKDAALQGKESSIYTRIRGVSRGVRDRVKRARDRGFPRYNRINAAKG